MDPVEGEKTFKLDVSPSFVDIPERRVAARQSGKRNRSPSPSRSEVSVVQSKYGAKQEAYTSPSEIATIFRNMITTDALCQLSAMSRGTPSDVKRITPGLALTRSARCVIYRRSPEGLNGASDEDRSARNATAGDHQSVVAVPGQERLPDTQPVDLQEETKVEREQNTQATVFPVPTPKKSE